MILHRKNAKCGINKRLMPLLLDEQFMDLIWKEL